MPAVALAKNPRRLSPVGALRIADPAAWARMVTKAMHDAGGRVPTAAVALDVSRRQLERWLRSEPLLADVERALKGTRPDDD